jgi:Gram-negative bacterial TonB protein C-terminal
MSVSKHLILWMLLAPMLCAQCRAPHYRMAGILAESDANLDMNISLPFQEFAPTSLVCLATSLKRSNSRRSTIIVNIYTSQKAASRSLGFLTDIEDTVEDRAALAHLHARYNFFAETHEEYIEIIPAGVTSAHSQQPYETRIDLPVASPIRCQLEMHGRCLIALQQFPYPAKLLKGKPSGSVTLGGTITRAGKVDHIRLVRAESISASAAIQNLASWRLEPGPRDEPIQITYSYAIDDSLRKMDGMQVQWALPNAVSIRIPQE